MGIKKKIYLVTNGDDGGRYCVEYAFTSKSEARYAQKLFQPYGAVIKVDINKMPPHKRDEKPYCVLVNDNGKAETPRRLTSDYEFIHATKQRWIVTTWVTGPRKNAEEPIYTYIDLWAHNPAVARLKAKIKFARLKKSGALARARAKFKAQPKQTGTPNAYPLAVNKPLEADPVKTEG